VALRYAERGDPLHVEAAMALLNRVSIYEPGLTII
jgi:hypothetical protein